MVILIAEACIPVTRQQIERALEAGSRLGFVVALDDDDYLGWILVSKRKPNLRFLELFTEQSHPKLVREQQRLLREPYFVHSIELRRDVHEAGGYETNADYRRQERAWFETLDDVAAYLQRLGYALEDAQYSWTLDAP